MNRKIAMLLATLALGAFVMGGLSSCTKVSENFIEKKWKITKIEGDGGATIFEQGATVEFKADGTCDLGVWELSDDNKTLTIDKVFKFQVERKGKKMLLKVGGVTITCEPA